MDKRGKVCRADDIGFVTGYEMLASDFLDPIFPPLRLKRLPSKTNPHEFVEKLKPEFTKAERFRYIYLLFFNSSLYTYWRTPANQIATIDDNELASYEFQRNVLSGKSPKRRALSF